MKLTDRREQRGTIEEVAAAEWNKNWNNSKCVLCQKQRTSWFT